MRNLLKKIFLRKDEINYLYFGFFLTFLTALSLFHYFNFEPPLNKMDLFFILYTIVQSFLETVVFVFLAHILKQWAPRYIYLSFISTSFIFLLLHFTNFTMVRLMDATIVYVFKFYSVRGLII